MSNKEVAQTLFVTIKTVETHLSSAYRKLEISSRAQLDNALLNPTEPGVRSGPVAGRPSVGTAEEHSGRAWGHPRGDSAPQGRTVTYRSS